METETQIKIRKAKPEEAVEIADVFSSLYSPEHGYTKPEVVKEDMENPRITSFVALEKNMIVGHGQLRPPEYDFCNYENNGVEMARLGVSKRHQNKGIGRGLVGALNDFTLIKNPGFVFADFNTATDYSQRAMKIIGLTPVTLVLGYTPDFANINQANSFLLGIKIAEQKEKATVYVHPEHRKLAGFVYNNLGLKREIKKKGNGIGDLSEFESQLEKYVDSSKGVIRNHSYNPNSMLIDLSNPSAIEKVELAKKAGLVVQGLVPLVREQDGTRHDMLVMGYIPHLNLNRIKTSPGQNEKFAEILLDGMYR